MVPHVNKPGHPPDVTALIITKETDVNSVQDSSRERVARNVLLVSKESIFKNVCRITMVMIVVIIYISIIT